MVPEFKNGDITERKIGRSSVCFLCVEHDVPTQDYPLSRMRDLVRNNCNGVVVEYFLPELKQNVFNTLYPGLKDEKYPDETGIIRFSQETNRIAQEERKNILAMDPANNYWFEILFQVAPIALSLAGYAAFFLSFDKREAQAGLTRREFFRYGGVATGLVGMEMASFRVQDVPVLDRFTGVYRENSLNLRDMRWVTVALGLDQYCREKEENLLVLYPPRHVEGILHYLDRPDERQFKYQVYRRIPGITRQIREYTVDEGFWKPVAKPRSIA